jgi:hypothetical protein
LFIDPITTNQPLLNDLKSKLIGTTWKIQAGIAIGKALSHSLKRLPAAFFRYPMDPDGLLPISVAIF